MVDPLAKKKLFVALQAAIFSEVAKQAGVDFPGGALEISPPNPLIIDDLETLHERGLLRWDAAVKFSSLCELIEKHPIKLCIYYKRKPVGYATGCFNSETNTVEIFWLEKRSDCDPDFDHKFFPLVLDAFSAYAMSLSLHDIFPGRIAVLSPIEACIAHYENSGMAYTEDYHRGCAAMILYRSV